MWPFTKRVCKKRTVNPMVYKRSYVGAESAGFYNWQSASDRSADGEVKSTLPVLRRRSRELIQNEPLAKRYLSLMNTKVIGKKGVTLQMKSRPKFQFLVGSRLQRNAYAVLPSVRVCSYVVSVKFHNTKITSRVEGWDVLRIRKGLFCSTTPSS